jgi:arylsulfatase A-like enzyme
MNQKYKWIFIMCLVLSNTTVNAQKKDFKQPNIIFVFADDWGYGDLGCYGNKEVKTPNLDKIAAEGTRFTQFYVTSGVCSPSRSSVITGHYPARNRIHGHLAENDLNEKRGMPNYLDNTLNVYLPREMQKAGYCTAHFGKWHLGGGGLPNGDPSTPEPKEYGYDATRVWNGNGPTWKGDQKWPTTRYMDSDTLWIQSSSKLAVNETIAFINNNKDKKPVFVNLWLKDPHTPLWPSDEQRLPYKGLSPDKEIYYSVLTNADYHIGRLMQAIKDMGIDENTIVIFSSDNGPAHYKPGLTAGSTAGLKGRKTAIFEGGINVPFIIRWPKHIKEGRVDSKSVLSTVDLLPTFVAIAGSKLPKEYKPDGENILSLFKNQTFKRTKPLFWEWRFPLVDTNSSQTNSWPQGAVRDGEWKLVFNEKINRFELYNISNDIFEKDNLAQANQKKINKMYELWKNWKATLPK